MLLSKSNQTRLLTIYKILLKSHLSENQQAHKDFPGSQTDLKDPGPILNIIDLSG